MLPIPPELLRCICRLSTLPTHPTQTERLIPMRDQSGPDEWRTKLSLVLVCKQWRAIASEFLYEEIYIENRAHRLLETLEESAKESEEFGYGRWVRRLVLSDKKPIRPIRLVDLLRYCFRVRTLIKRIYDPYKPSCDSPLWKNLIHVPSDTPPFPPLSSLHSIYWTCGSYRYDDLHRLSEIILHSPNLQALYIVFPSGKLFGRVTCRSRRTVPFPSLQKFVVATTAPSLSELGIQVDDVPNLTHLAFFPFRASTRDAASTAFEFLRQLGKQLRTVELLPNSGIVENSVIKIILQECPNVHEFIFNIHPIQLHLDDLSTPLTSLATVRIRFDVNNYTSRPYVSSVANGRTEAELQADTFQHLQNHFNALTGRAFPALRCIVLDGQHWAWTLKDPRFVPLRASLHQRGYRLELADGTLL